MTRHISILSRANLRPSFLHFGWLMVPAILATPFAKAAESELAQPRQLIVERGIPKSQAEAQMTAARRYDTFWSSGDTTLARSALAPDFIDRTLPPGRPQGVAGPLAAYETIHAAIPDIRCEIEQMIVVRDRVIVHLHFSGHFTGHFAETRGQGQPVDFIATDIYRIADGRIAENWHIEDNLTLLKQLGQITR